MRFGFRDYAPEVGRFTCLDPLGDTGGDHDLYDYCVDDPVSLVDVEGLLPIPLLIMAGIGLSGLIGGAVLYGSAKLVDGIKTYRDGEESTAARDAMKKIAPIATAIHTNAFFPGQLAVGAVTAGMAGIGRALTGKTLFEFIKNGQSDTSKPKN